MTLDEALEVTLPIGKRFADATPNDVKAALRHWNEEGERMETVGVEGLSQDDRSLEEWAALLKWTVQFKEAWKTIEATLEGGNVVVSDGYGSKWLTQATAFRGKEPENSAGYWDHLGDALHHAAHLRSLPAVKNA